MNIRGGVEGVELVLVLQFFNKIRERRKCVSCSLPMHLLCQLLQRATILFIRRTLSSGQGRGTYTQHPASYPSDEEHTHSTQPRTRRTRNIHTALSMPEAHDGSRLLKSYTRYDHHNILINVSFLSYMIIYIET